jgi:hypothetical protein
MPWWRARAARLLAGRSGEAFGADPNRVFYMIGGGEIIIRNIRIRGC